jgi:DNA-binding response OmpR family regulator
MVKAAVDSFHAKPGSRIVVVDDDEVVTNVVVCVLREAGYDVEGACSPEDALQVTRARPPALVITDVRMPGLDGFDLCTMLKDHPRTRKIPVVFLSGWTEENDHTLGRLLGGAGFIDKPFNAETLLVTVEQVLRKNRADGGPRPGP